MKYTHRIFFMSDNFSLDKSEALRFLILLIRETCYLSSHGFTLLQYQLNLTQLTNLINSYANKCSVNTKWRLSQPYSPHQELAIQGTKNFSSVVDFVTCVAALYQTQYVQVKFFKKLRESMTKTHSMLKVSWQVILFWVLVGISRGERSSPTSKK